MCILAYQISLGVKYGSDKLGTAEITINRITDRLRGLARDTDNKKFSDKINRIAEAIRFSDTSANVPSDVEIESKLSILELALLKETGTKEDTVNVVLEDISLLVGRRKSEVKNIKRGSV